MLVCTKVQTQTIQSIKFQMETSFKRRVKAIINSLIHSMYVWTIVINDRFFIYSLGYGKNGLTVWDRDLYWYVNSFLYIHQCKLSVKCDPCEANMRFDDNCHS